MVPNLEIVWSNSKALSDVTWILASQVDGFDELSVFCLENRQQFLEALAKLPLHLLLLGNVEPGYKLRLTKLPASTIGIRNCVSEDCIEPGNKPFFIFQTAKPLDGLCEACLNYVLGDVVVRHTCPHECEEPLPGRGELI